MNPTALVFTDGASSGNPGPSGWGAILLSPEGQVTELGGGERLSTNNRMEMTAAIESLRRIQSKTPEVVIYTDSKYLIQGISEWVRGWIRSGWITSQGNPVSNEDLWKDLLREVEKKKVQGTQILWKYVPGHAGIPGNERADQIAVAYSKGESPDLFSGSVKDYPHDLLQDSPSGDEERPRKKKSSKKGKAYSYLSLVNGVPQRHSSWQECEARVKGRAGVRFEKALSPEEEGKILAKWGVKGRLPEK